MGEVTLCRGSTLIRNRPSEGPYNRTIYAQGITVAQGVGLFFLSGVPLQFAEADAQGYLAHEVQGV